MCGIAGFEERGSRKDPVAAAEELLDALESRGPDGRAHAEHAGYRLAQTRLAVMDLSERVSYPMRNESGDLHLLFNGEIYDHRLLRVELEGLGHEFATDCDAEVVLHGYEEWGLEVLGRLDGMFALALVHEPSGEIVLARDATGIKPLVRTTGEPFAFASDAKALVAAGISEGEVDREAVAEYSAFHYVPHPRTGIAGIAQVEPGTALRRSRGGNETVERWAPRPFDGPAPDSPVTEDHLLEALRASVGRQLVADVEVGVFLSGGIDSSLLLALAVQAGASPRAFTIGFPGSGDYDEAPRAAEVAGSLGVSHEVRALDTSFAESADRVGEAYDQPFGDSSAIATLQLARLAREQATVALSGTGGDDLFAGYYRHRAHKLRRAVSWAPASLRSRISRAGVARGDERRSGAGLARSYLVRLAGAGGDSAAEQYLGLVGAMTSAAGLEALTASPTSGAAARVGERLGLGDASGDTLRRLQGFEFATYVPGDLLTKEDRATMAAGLEARVPLLGREVVSLAESMPDPQKTGLTKGKLPLRAIAARLLPPAALRGRKRGFAVPLAELFAGRWRSEAREWLLSSESELVDVGAAAALIDRTPSVATDIWALSALVSWERSLEECRRRAARLPDSARAQAGP